MHAVPVPLHGDTDSPRGEGDGIGQQNFSQTRLEIRCKVDDGRLRLILYRVHQFQYIPVGPEDFSDQNNQKPEQYSRAFDQHDILLHTIIHVPTDKPVDRGRYHNTEEEDFQIQFSVQQYPKQ